jgi:hypothetical protein
LSKNTAPLNIDRAAWLLIRKFGDDCALAAYTRGQYCRCHGQYEAASEWQLVLLKVIELHFKQPSGPKH